MNDPVNNPAHYTSHPSGIECIRVTEHMNFNRGNAVKYLWRADHKNGIQDLQKARWYIDREITRLDDMDRAEEMDKHLTPLSAALAAPAPLGAKRGRKASKDPRKWTKETLAKLTDDFLAHVKKHPGQRSEEIAAALSYSKLPMPAIRAALGKKLILKGKRRGTRYFARGAK